MNRSRILDRSAAPARRFNALADPARLAILGELRSGTRCVCELQVDLDMPSNLLSYHLRILREAGLVSGTRRGRRTEYRIRAEGLEALRRQVEELAVPGTRR
jgi:ArsR family transcriptional regulator